MDDDYSDEDQILEPRPNDHDFIYLPDGTARCGKCDARLGGRVASKPCGFKECLHASTAQQCENPATWKLGLQATPTITSYVYTCKTHVLGELEYQMFSRPSGPIPITITPIKQEAPA